MTVRFCTSRNQGRRCTRHLDHPGLHRHRTIMWADATADDEDGRLVEHDTSDPAESDSEVAQHRNWFNTHAD